MTEKRDGLTLLAYILIGAGAAIYGGAFAIAFLTGLVLAGPFSFLALIVLGLPVLGVLILLIKVINDRAKDAEDRHYSKNIYD